MANDIQAAISGNPVKNGTLIVGCYRTGFPTLPTTIVYDEYVQNYPTITDLEAKYDNRFYNGIFVQLVGDQTVIGG
jgi:hypothetical protein